MSKRDIPISRSFHAPHGVNINGYAAPKVEKVKRKHSLNSGRIRNAMSDTMLSNRTAVLKEGYLYKQAFFRLGGRKRIWCVLRAFSQSEPATLDVYYDCTKTRLKRSIALERFANPIVIKSTETSSGKKRQVCKQGYFALKTGKTLHHFTTDSRQELEEWCALMRQAMDSGQTFSGRVSEPSELSGTVNIRFQPNCIVFQCPISEKPLKSWRLDQVTSFGQCGNIFTFECCAQCSDANCSRTSTQILQDNPLTILNVMERAIRNSQPHSSEIHYERSMLGDIYHCRHNCGGIHGRLRGGSTSPIKMTSAFHPSALEETPSYSKATESSDSGLPGTPQAEESLSLVGGIPSPTAVSKYNPNTTIGPRILPPISVVTPQKLPFARDRSISDTQVLLSNSADLLLNQKRRSDESSCWGGSESDERPLCAKVGPAAAGSVNYARLELMALNGRTPALQGRQQQQGGGGGRKNDPLYDEPPSEPSAVYGHPPHRQREGSFGGKTPLSPKTFVTIPLQAVATVDTGDDDSEGDYFDLGPPPVPTHKKPLKTSVTATAVNGKVSPAHFRGRLHSSSEILDVRSKEPLQQDRELRGSTDLLARLHEEEKKLTSILEHTRRACNVPSSLARPSTTTSPKKTGELRSPVFPLKEGDYDEPDANSDLIEETCSNLVEYAHKGLYSSPVSDKLLSKVPSTSVRGYAYKITIPIPESDVQYDVPRRAAPAPDLGRVPGDAPPKPRREQLCVK